MKKIFITIAIVLGMTLCASAQYDGGGLFHYGAVSNEEYYGAGNRLDEGGLMNFSLPTSHGSETDQNSVPVGSGIVLLVGLGAAYASAKRNRKESINE